jgi:uncharacterized protein (TIGR02453 family)
VNDPLDVTRTLKFLRALKRNNDRGWFAEHRAPYDEHIKPGWEDLVAGLLVTAAAFDERLAHVDPRRCLFRLHRDIRFSNDKTPFKTHLSAFLSPFGKHGSNAGFYISLEPGDSLFAAGIYTPEKEVLLALRRHFADDARPFVRLLGTKKLAPYLPLGTDPLRITPRGLPKEHPNPELIRARRYMVRRAIPDAELPKRGAFATFQAMMRDCAPFVAYLDRIASGAED